MVKVPAILERRFLKLSSLRLLAPGRMRGNASDLKISARGSLRTSAELTLLRRCLGVSRKETENSLLTRKFAKREGAWRK